MLVTPSAQGSRNAINCVAPSVGQHVASSSDMVLGGVMDVNRCKGIQAAQRLSQMIHMSSVINKLAARSQ